MILLSEQFYQGNAATVGGRAYSNASATHFNGFEPAQVVHVNE